MAAFTTNTAIAEEKQGVLSRFFARLGANYEAYAYHKSRRAEIETLEAMSDEELRKLGVKREDIAFFVFQDMFYA